MCRKLYVNREIQASTQKGLRRYHLLVLRNKDSREVSDHLSINFNGEPLSNVKAYKYLGVDIDMNLTYESAVHNTYIKANKKLFTLRKIRPYITQRIAALVYKQFILTILDYADFLFDSSIKYELDLLDRIQDRALRLISRGQLRIDYCGWRPIW